VLKKKNKILILFCCICLLFLNSSFAFALEIPNYPNLGINPPTEGDLPSYVIYIFTFVTYIAGVIAIISFAIGAVQLILAAASPSMAGEAKDRMRSAILGLVLTVAAVAILRTINMAIITPTLTELPTGDGLFYTNGPNYQAAPGSESDTSDIPNGYRTLAYRCSGSDVLLIWKFPKANFKGNDDNYGGVTVVRKKCGQTESLSGAGSFKTSTEAPGIYYCLEGCSGDMCSGYMSEANAISSVVGSTFKNKIKSIRIVNDLSEDLHYGVIFHSKDDPTAAGNCTQPLFSKDASKEIECFNDVAVSASTTVFYWNDKKYLTSGQGIDFYSEPFGWGKGSRAAKYSLDAKTIGENWSGNSGSLTLNYTGIERPSRYKQLYQTFQQRSGSVKVKGNYVLVLWAGSSCQVFFQDVVNLKSTELTATGGSIQNIYIIPAK